MRQLVPVGVWACLLVVVAQAHTPAQDAARRAESTQARLRAAEDDLAAATHDIVRAKALMAIGDVLADAQDVSAAKSYYERSLEMVDRLAGSKPEDMDGWRAKIVVLTRLGDLFDLWDQPMSTAYHQQSLEIAERLLKEHPASQVAQREVREALTRVGGAAVMSDDPATSIPVLSRAMTIAQSLVDANPGDTGAQNDLFLCYVHLGFASDNLNDSDGKMTWWRKAVALGEALERAAALPLESQGHLAVARSRLIK